MWRIIKLNSILHLTQYDTICCVQNTSTYDIRLFNSPHLLLLCLRVIFNYTQNELKQKFPLLLNLFTYLQYFLFCLHSFSVAYRLDYLQAFCSSVYWPHVICSFKSNKTSHEFYFCSSKLCLPMYSSWYCPSIIPNRNDWCHFCRRMLGN